MVTQLIAFFILWWLVFMTLIPCWVKIEKKPQKGNADSAPINPNLAKKALWATVITVVLYALFCYVIETTGFSLRSYFAD